MPFFALPLTFRALILQRTEQNTEPLSGELDGECGVLPRIQYGKRNVWRLGGVSCAAKGIALRFVQGRGLVDLSCCVRILNDAVFLTC
jgi:hypothetical protein